MREDISPREVNFESLEDLQRGDLVYFEFLAAQDIQKGDQFRWRCGPHTGKAEVVGIWKPRKGQVRCTARRVN